VADPVPPAPWNIVARDGMPVALIDWEFAGPVDPLVELAQAAWLNAKLHDDLVAQIAGITPETTAHPVALWAMAWRARAGAWIVRNRRPLSNALA
jgi:aminoglycoside phosphotransferase (APT) family kinase protein